MLSRAALLVICVATLAPAAPAPQPRRQREPAGSGGWSRVVDGVRARLVASKTRYKAGEPIVFTLEIQNVSGEALTIEEPELGRIASDQRNLPGGWALTAESTERR